MSFSAFVEQAKRRGDLSLSCLLQAEESRGEMELVSADPHVQPELRYHYLSEPNDMRRMREVVRLSVDLLASAPFRGIVKRRTDPVDADLGSDRALDAWIRSRLFTTI